MARPFTAICPPTVETRLTGFIGAGERTIRGKVLRCEWWNGKTARLFRDGQPVDVDLSKDASARALVRDSHAFFCQR